MTEIILPGNMLLMHYLVLILVLSVNLFRQPNYWFVFLLNPSRLFCHTTH